VKTTRPLTLISIAAGALLVAILLARFLISKGFAFPDFPRSMLITVPTIAVVLVILAIPMFRYRKGLKDLAAKKTTARPKRPDSFYAVRLLVLAKAAAMAGSLFLGWLGGVILIQLSTPVSLWERSPNNLAGLGAAIILIAAGVVVERACRLPEDTNAPDSEAAPA
jgi:hypothetical protein